ncbi:MAG: PKD domain-containing protein, partial [Flavobacteriales bacterium]|nr:PKD domain-containing protein [Flavobacteriales bacterium]
PIAQFTPDVLDGCAPLDVLFQDQTIGASTMDWDFGDGTGQLTGPGDIAHTFTNTSASTQYFDVELIAGTDFGCTDTTLHTIGVYPPVTALFTMDTAGCSPFSPIITDLSQGANNYLWDMGDGTLLVGPSPSYTYLNNTTNDQQYTVTLITTSAFGCTDTLDQPIVVHPVPVAGFQATPFTQQYPASTVSFNNLSGPGNWNYSWDLGDGTSSSAQDPADHDYGTWGTFTISLIVSGTMCSDTAMQLVEILPPPPTASFQGGGQGCAPLTVQFTNTSVQATNFQWNFGDGSTSSATDPIHTYTVPGTYTVTLTAFGLGGSANTYVQVDSVIVHPNATAYFVLQPTQVVVPSQPVFTYNLSGNATDFQWDFGDGTTS